MAAIKTLTVTTHGPDRWKIETHAGKHPLIVDQPESLGSNDQGPSPLDYVFVALASCIITIGKMVAMQKKITLRSMECVINGDINLDILRGKEMNEWSGFKNISAEVKIDTDLNEQEKKEFMEEVDRRCPVSDNLITTTPI